MTKSECHNNIRTWKQGHAPWRLFIAFYDRRLRGNMSFTSANLLSFNFVMLLERSGMIYPPLTK